MTRGAALPGVAGGALLRALAVAHTMTFQESGRIMGGRCRERGLDGERARIGGERCDGRLLRSVHMTTGAEVPRVAGGTAHVARFGGRSVRGREVLCFMGRWRGKMGDVLASERGGLGQGKVTGGALRVGGGEMCRPDAMTREAVLHHCGPHRHRGSASHSVTAGTGRLLTPTRPCW